MLVPVSFKLLATEIATFDRLVFNSCLYFAKKCMVLSIEIPYTILKIKPVLGFNGIPKYPIIPAVSIIGIILGMMEIMIILTLLKSSAIKNEFITNDNSMLPIRLSIR